MEISLIRHGKSRFTENNRIAYKEFKNWVERYDNNGVFEEISYPSTTLEKMAAANIVVTSDVKRSVESASLLHPNLDAVSDPLFRETELPVLSANLGGIKFNPGIWAVMLRCLWFTGYSRQCESLSKAKYRAKKASEQLIKYANKYKSVALVGHGFFNLLIAKELQKMGWKGKRKTGAKHWNCTTYAFFS